MEAYEAQEERDNIRGFLVERYGKEALERGNDASP